jgi:CheY-like chemotaxis protein
MNRPPYLLPWARGLLHEVQRRYASTPVIAVSGYSDLQEKALREAAFARVLRKPIDP